MSDDLVSLRMLLVAVVPSHQELWRQGTALASVPIDFEAADAAAARAMLAKGGVDICVLDDELDDADKTSVIKAARKAGSGPLIFLSAPRGSRRPDNIDGLLAKPASAAAARKLAEICIRAKMPTQVLIVDDSETMRGIVRKILAASRFELDIHEAEDSGAALNQLRNGKFGMVFLDYSMPSLNGTDILQGIKRESPQTAIVMMTTALDKPAAGSRRLSGTLALLTKPFFPVDVDAVLARYFGLHDRDVP
jgi:DNA-binding response OmpR family regulator